jgi:hypothetical protein
MDLFVDLVAFAFDGGVVHGIDRAAGATLEFVPRGAFPWGKC